MHSASRTMWRLQARAPPPLTQAQPGACSVLRCSCECKMGHIPDRRISRVKRRRPFRPAKSLFPSSCLFCWARKQARLMNHTRPSLLTTKRFALKNNREGLCSWMKSITIEEAKVNHGCFGGLSLFLRARFLHIVDHWSLTQKHLAVCTEENDCVQRLVTSF